MILVTGAAGEELHNGHCPSQHEMRRGRGCTGAELHLQLAVADADARTNPRARDANKRVSSRQIAVLSSLCCP